VILVLTELKLPDRFTCKYSCVFWKEKYIVVIGGYFERKIYCFNTETERWTVAGEFAASPHPVPNAHCACLISDDMCIAINGYCDAEFISFLKLSETKDEEVKVEAVATYFKESLSYPISRTHSLVIWIFSTFSSCETRDVLLQAQRACVTASRVLS